MSNTPRLGMPEISESQSAKYLTHNEALRIGDALIQPVAISNVISTPPGSPVDGDTYIVGVAATGDWAGHEDDIAYWRATAWTFITPEAGWHFWILSSDEYFVFESVSAGWVSESQPFFYDLGCGVNGVTTASQVILRAAMVRSVDFQDDFAGSVGKAEIAATAQTDFDVSKNGSSIGTVRFAAAGTTATFISSGAQSAVSGDVLRIVGPASPDATLANIAITLSGTKA